MRPFLRTKRARFERSTLSAQRTQSTRAWLRLIQPTWPLCSSAACTASQSPACLTTLSTPGDLLHDARPPRRPPPRPPRDLQLPAAARAAVERDAAPDVGRSVAGRLWL